jgi:LemA protein
LRNRAKVAIWGVPVHSHQGNRHAHANSGHPLVLLAGLLSGCGYNTFQTGDEAIKSAWSEVLNQYQRRADLVPNLVSTVQGYASHEKDVLTQVTQARAQVGAIQATPELVNDPEAFAKFQQAQAGLSSALSRCWWSPRTIRN